MAKKSKKQADSIRSEGGPGTIAVSRETRDKLKKKAGDVPLSRFLKRVAEAEEAVCPEWNICRADEHEFKTIVTYETGEVAGYVGVEWCSKCGIIHENTYAEDGNFVAPYKSYVPTGRYC